MCDLCFWSQPGAPFHLPTICVVQGVLFYVRTNTRLLDLAKLPPYSYTPTPNALLILPYITESTAGGGAAHPLP